MAPTPTTARWPSAARALAETLAYTGLAALAARWAEPWLDPQSLALFFVAPIVLAAIRFGLWASLGASLLSTLAVNFLFVEPRYTFVVARAQDAVALTLFAAVGVLTSAMAAQARHNALQAKARAREAGLLERYATRLAAAKNQDEIARIATGALADLSGIPALLIGADGQVFGGAASMDAQESAKWAMSTKLPILASSPDGAITEWSFWPIIRDRSGVWALGFGPAQDARAEVESAAAQIAAHAGVALERARLAQAAEEARLEVERERFKALLLAGVSHDLRTPLATIVFTLQSLLRFSAALEDREELLTLAEKEARRLSDLVETLLDASRIEAGAVPVHAEEVSPQHLVERAIEEVRGQAGECAIALKLDPDLPSVRADPALAAHALSMLVHNAVRHAAPRANGEAIMIEAIAEPGEVVIDVSDHGPGLGANPEQLFGSFIRGVPGDGRPPGLGLGLSIARGLIESQGGRITAANRPGGGAVFRIRLPRFAAESGHVD